MQNSKADDWIELVDAIVTYEKPTARKFKLGIRFRWIPTKVSRVDGFKLYVRRWKVYEKLYDWHCEFTTTTQVRAMQEITIDELENAARAMQKQLENMWRVIDAYKKTRDGDGSDDITDAEADLIRKTTRRS